MAMECFDPLLAARDDDGDLGAVVRSRVKLHDQLEPRSGASSNSAQAWRPCSSFSASINYVQSSSDNFPSSAMSSACGVADTQGCMFAGRQYGVAGHGLWHDSLGPLVSDHVASVTFPRRCMELMEGDSSGCVEAGISWLLKESVDEMCSLERCPDYLPSVAEATPDISLKRLHPVEECCSQKVRGAKRSSPRRKAQQKRVVCMPAPTPPTLGRGGSESVVPSSDMWAWRKYGQKPIKGSPHPRGYYRCSSSRGCPARKQVERDPCNPSMLLVTYTSDHNHPWPPAHRLISAAPRTDPCFIAPNPSVETPKTSAEVCLSDSPPYSGKPPATPTSHKCSSEHDKNEEENKAHVEHHSENSSLALFATVIDELQGRQEILHEPTGGFGLVDDREADLDDAISAPKVDPFNLFSWS